MKEIHSILLDSVRGQNKARGQLMNSLFNLEHYIHYDEKDKLVQLAIIHAQFEILHPFLDGNGRVGRILIPLFLFEKKLLGTPMFYLSEYLEEHRDTYYTKLNGITATGNWEDWIEFFLPAIIEQSKNNSHKAKTILQLYDEKKNRIMDATHSKYTVNILDSLFSKPIFTINEFAKLSQIPKASVHRIIQQLEENEIIHTIDESRGRKPKIMIFTKLLEIIR